VKHVRLFVVAALATLAMLVPATQASAAGYSDAIHGTEYFATSTEGRFAGVAGGSLPGTWNVDVVHTPLCLSCAPTATITSGSFELVTAVNALPTIVDGIFSGGLVQVVNPGSNCTNQTFLVNGILAGVHSSAGGNGTGTFDVTLTHYRASIFGRCITYGATVSGTLALSF
jgi:hypothetical protein